MFDVYVGNIDDSSVKSTNHGKTFDLVMNMMDPFKKQGYHIYMDNFYSSPILFYKLRVEENTLATGTVRPRKGLPKELSSAKFKNHGEHKIMSYKELMVTMRILDRKHVTLLSTGHDCKLVKTGRNHYRSNEPLYKHNLVHLYNKYMGRVDLNDQLLKYSAFNRRSVKWWKKLLFRVLNLAMVNAFICFKEWMSKTNTKHISQTEFRTCCIQQILDSVAGDVTSPVVQRRSVIPGEMKRLTERHFFRKIPTTGQKSRISRSCSVCVPAERQMGIKIGVKRKRPGHESSYECSECLPLCADPCFAIYYQHKDYIAKYISLKNA